MRIVSIMAAVCFCLLAGCASRKPAPAASPGQKFEADDAFRIEAAVYAYLLEKHPWGSGQYAAIFLPGHDARVAELIRRFPRQVPPLKPDDQMQLLPNQAPMDRETGKPGVLLGAKAIDPANGVSEAIGTWHGGGDAAGRYALVLVEADGTWTIQSVR